VRDISERKRERDVAVRLAAIVESSNDAIIGKDLQGRITSWNRAAAQTFGYSAEQVIGQDITLLFPPDRLHEEQQILERVRGGEQIKHFETQRRAADGRLLEMSLTISPILDASGCTVGASTSAHCSRRFSTIAPRSGSPVSAAEKRSEGRASGAALGGVSTRITSLMRESRSSSLRTRHPLAAP